jgi:peptidoglycan hydrolase-like protein with peptidoglycan-binding domain
MGYWPAVKKSAVPSLVPAPASEKRILQAQGLLKAAGLDPGPTDGVLGERTCAALRQYQQAHGLPVTGGLDQATQAALGMT